MSQSATLPAPIAPQSATTCPTVLLVKGGKGRTLGASGKLLDASGKMVFNIRAKLMTASGRRIVQDARKKDVGQMKKKHRVGSGLHDEWFFGPMDNVKKCSVKCTSDRTQEENRHKWGADIYLDGTVIGDAHGNWEEKSFQISLGGRQVAQVRKPDAGVESLRQVRRRSTKTFEVITEDQAAESAFEEPALNLTLGVDFSYLLEISEGVDAAFIVLVVMGLDEIDAVEPGRRST